MHLLTLVAGSHPWPGCPDWAFVGAEAFAAVGVVLLGPPGPEQQAEAAGWWVLQGDPAALEPSVAVPPPVTAAWGAGPASAEVGLPQVSGQGLPQLSAAGRQTVASEPEVNLPGSAEESPGQKEVSGLEWIPDPVAVAGLQVLG